VTLAGIIAPYENAAITVSLSEATLAVYINEGERVHNRCSAFLTQHRYRRDSSFTRSAMGG